METRKLHSEFLVGKLKGRGHKEDQAADGSIIFKTVLKVGGLEPE